MEKAKENSGKRFIVYVNGVIFDPKTRKILINKGGEINVSKDLPGFTWGFIGGRAKPGKDLDKTLKKLVKERTGLRVSNLGAIFAKTFPENGHLIAIYFLCESFAGKLRRGKNVAELKWVSPEHLEKHFTTSFHPRLKEYIMNLR